VATQEESRNMRFIKTWINGNIFRNNKVDGTLYLFFYIIIPVLVAIISLKVSDSEHTAIVYCYLSILISTFNCLYDSGNRWISGKKTFHNVKLFLMMVSNIVIAIYCLFVIFYVLILKDIGCRIDWILCIYLISMTIASIDIISCYVKDMAIYSCLEGDE